MIDEAEITPKSFEKLEAVHAKSYDEMLDESTFMNES